MNLLDLPTPALVIDADALGADIATMAAALPGARLRPEVKAVLLERWTIDLCGW